MNDIINSYYGIERPAGKRMLYLDHRAAGDEVDADASYAVQLDDHVAGAVDAFDGALHAGEGAGADQHTAVLVAAQFVGPEVGVFAFGARGRFDEVVHLALGHGEYLRRCVGAVHRPSRHIAHQGGYGVGVLQFRDALHRAAHKDEIADGGAAAMADAPVASLGMVAHR